MWRIISLLLPWFIGIMIVSQVIIPLILKKDMFWLFRKKKKQQFKNPTSLEEEISSAWEDVFRTEEKVAGVKNKANENYEEAKKLKKKADSI